MMNKTKSTNGKTNDGLLNDSSMTISTLTCRTRFSYGPQGEAFATRPNVGHNLVSVSRASRCTRCASTGQTTKIRQTARLAQIIGLRLVVSLREFCRQVLERLCYPVPSGI